MERFIGRVAKALGAAQQRGQALQVRLSPPELGHLRIELTIQQGVLSASLETETTAARNVLLDNLPALRDRLAEQGIRVERFDVDVSSDDEQQRGQAPGDPTRQQRRSNDTSWQRKGQDEVTAESDGEVSTGVRTRDSGFDAVA